MKQAMRPYLPDSVLFRAKMGFVTPIGAWLRGPLAGEALAIGQSGTLAETGWFDSSRITALADAHIAGRAEHGRLLWQLLMLDKALTRLARGSVR